MLACAVHGTRFQSNRKATFLSFRCQIVKPLSTRPFQCDAGDSPAEAAADTGGPCLRCLLPGMEPRQHLPDRLRTRRLLRALALEHPGTDTYTRTHTHTHTHTYTQIFPTVFMRSILVCVYKPKPGTTSLYQGIWARML